MSSQCIIAYVIIIVNMMIVSGKCNIFRRDMVSSGDQMKEESFGCLPTDDWKLLIQTNFGNNVCVTRDHNPDIAANDEGLNPHILVLHRRKLLKVHEKENTILLEIMAFLIWKDDRIKDSVPYNNHWTELPSFTTERNSAIWTPIKRLVIDNMRKLEYIENETIMRIFLGSTDLANKLFTANNFRGKSSVVMAIIRWRLTISCPFDFSHFPFDIHKCPLIIRFMNMNVTYPLHKFSWLEEEVQKEAEGFRIKMIKMGSKKYKTENLNMHWSEMGYDIELERQPEKYIYQYYIPCSLIVIASSCSFIIPLSAIPGRVALVVTQFLTLINIFMNLMVSLFKAG